MEEKEKNRIEQNGEILHSMMKTKYTNKYKIQQYGYLKRKNKKQYTNK